MPSSVDLRAFASFAVPGLSDLEAFPSLPVPATADRECCSTEKRKAGTRVPDRRSDTRHRAEHFAGRVRCGTGIPDPPASVPAPFRFLLQILRRGALHCKSP